jgi:quercetin 2,3-dioxygenase
MSIRCFLWLCLLTSMASLHVHAQGKPSLRYMKAQQTEEGDGASVNRLIPQKGLKHYDPYVLFDDFTIIPPSGFPDHFHSGFEVITYLKTGSLQHKDNIGHDVVLYPGDVQCFTTGSGVVHSEMPQSKENVKGFQIWVNLPKTDKQMPPAYAYVRSAAVPVVQVNDQVRIKTIAGHGATVRTRAELLIQEFDIKAGSHYKITLPSGYQGFLYVQAGVVSIEDKSCMQGDAVVFSQYDLTLRANNDVTFLLVSGLPLREPIQRRGSIVK